MQHGTGGFSSYAVLDRMLAAGISSQQLRGGRRGLPARGDAQGPSTQQGAWVPARSHTASPRFMKA